MNKTLGNFLNLLLTKLPLLLILSKIFIPILERPPCIHTHYYAYYQISCKGWVYLFESKIEVPQKFDKKLSLSQVTTKVRSLTVF